MEGWKMAEDDEKAERNQQVMRYRILEREVTDPLAAGLLRQIVSEMEAMAFSSETETGSRQENAPEQEAKAAV
jgi:hypothetical protein